MKRIKTPLLTALLISLLWVLVSIGVAGFESTTSAIRANGTAVQHSSMIQTR